MNYIYVVTEYDLDNIDHVWTTGYQTLVSAKAEIEVDRNNRFQNYRDEYHELYKDDPNPEVANCVYGESWIKNSLLNWIQLDETEWIAEEYEEMVDVCGLSSKFVITRVQVN